MSYKIVIDSCGELPASCQKDPRFESVPLTLSVDGEEIIDDATFDQKSFLAKVAASPNCPKSSCPSPERYKKAYDCPAEHIYAVTLSAELSGSYNSAMLGRQLLLEELPGKKIYVFNSRSASIGETLIALKIQELEEAGLAFEEVVTQTEAYIRGQITYFILENLETMRKNGRMGRVKALVASALNIKPVLGSNDEGAIVQRDQARGMNKALVKMVNLALSESVDLEKKTIAISHCNCPERAQMLKEAILEKAKVRDVVLLDTAGVSSMYANDGGIILVI